MPVNAQEYAEFLKLITIDGPKQEVACAKYLAHATLRLFPSFPSVAIEVDLEERMHFGRSDFLVVGEFKSGVGRPERRIYFWELKAAQCFLVQRDDADTRVRPTIDLVKAETQLIHYVQEARGSDMFLRKFDVRRENIKMGGIIIGRDGRLWNPAELRLQRRDAELSFDLREEVIYKPLGIQIVTWDRIAEDLNPA